MTKRDYHVDLSALMRIYETNYAKLLKLLPKGQKGGENCKFDIQGKCFELKILDVTRYTTLLEIYQCDEPLEYMRPYLKIRMYHDARVAEVCASQQIYFIQARYDYPNPKMHQSNEKHQVNAFLADWLTHCLRYGVSINNSTF